MRETTRAARPHVTSRRPPAVLYVERERASERARAEDVRTTSGCALPPNDAIVTAHLLDVERERECAELLAALGALRAVRWNVM